MVVLWARVFEFVRVKSSSNRGRGVWSGEYFWNWTLDLIFDSFSASAICILLHSCIALSTLFTATRRSLTDSLGSSFACTPQPNADPRAIATNRGRHTPPARLRGRHAAGMRQASRNK